MFTMLQSGSEGDRLSAVKNVIRDLDVAATDAGMIDQIRSLDELEAGVAARRMVVTAAFAASQRAAQVAAGVPKERVGRGVAAQVGLARRMSPTQANRYVGQAIILTRELPECFAQLVLGVVPEWRVLQVARETAWLSVEHRAIVDSEIAPQLERLGNRQTIDLTKKIALRLDPRGYLDRLAQAETERTVTTRPAPDCMIYLTALLPVKQGVAAYAALKIHADTIVGHGSETRGRGQVMADTLVERVTGQATANNVPVTVNLIMTDQTLFNTGRTGGGAGGGGTGASDPGPRARDDSGSDAGRSGAGSDEPAYLIGGGTVPAEIARRMTQDPSGDAAVFLRRLYTDPTTGQLTAMDTRSRLFTENQRLFLLLRDQTCRTPYCDAPIRHADHITPFEQGGPTSIINAQGLCEACNHAKQANGWYQRPAPDGSGDINTYTPTGHLYRSRAPDPPGVTPRTRPERQSREPTCAAA